MQSHRQSRSKEIWVPVSASTHVARFASRGVGLELEGGPVILEMLGGFRLTVRGVVVTIPLAAQKVVAFLAVRSVLVARKVVAGALWPTVPADRSRANLRTALWKFPAQPKLVESVGQEIRLHSNVWVDAVEATSTLRRLLSEDEPLGDDGRTFLWADLLPDWYDDWVVVERERLSNLRLEAQEAACTQLVQAGRSAQAVAVGLACVSADPLQEGAQRALIEAHLAAGNLCNARRQYEEYGRLLREELGESPSRSLAVLLDGRCMSLGDRPTGLATEPS